MGDLKIKLLTRENWLTHDAILRWGKWEGGKVVPVRGEELVEAFQEIQLDGGVPDNIRTMFEVARGALVYGYFFYPLYDLGIEHLYKVAEAAITTKFQVVKDSPSDSISFRDKIEFLHRRGTLTDSEREQWHLLRRGRNSASHPCGQAIVTPGMAIAAFEGTKLMVNSLFAI